MKAKISCARLSLFDLLLDDSYRQKWDDNHEMQANLNGFLITENKFDETIVAENLRFLISASNDIPKDEKEELQHLVQNFEKKTNYRIKLLSTQYSRMKSPAPMLVAKRDFVTVCIVAHHVDTNDVAFCLTSLDDYPLPIKLEQEIKKAKYVRATHIATGTLLRDDGDLTELISVSMIDPGAYVPPRIIKMFAPQTAEDLTEVAPLAEERKKESLAGASIFLEIR